MLAHPDIFNKLSRLIRKVFVKVDEENLIPFMETKIY